MDGTNRAPVFARQVARPDVKRGNLAKHVDADDKTVSGPGFDSPHLHFLRATWS